MKVSKRKFSSFLSSLDVSFNVYLIHTYNLHVHPFVTNHGHFTRSNNVTRFNIYMQFDI